MNTKFARLKNGKIEYALSMIKTARRIVMNPSEATLIAAGWKRVVDEHPEPQLGKYTLATGWRIEGESIVRVYEYRTNDIAGRRIFSRLKIVSALQSMGKWDAFKAWLEANGYYDVYLAAQNFAEDNPLFVAGRAAAASWHDAV